MSEHVRYCANCRKPAGEPMPKGWTACCWSPIGCGCATEQDAPTLRTEYGWAPHGDVSEVSLPWDQSDPVACERWVRESVANLGGSVFVREVTEWRQEP